MCASQVRLFGEERLDSAGMLVARRRQQQAARPWAAAGGFSGGGRGAVSQRLGGALPARHAGADRRLRRRLLPLLRRYRSGAARALGRLEVPVRAGGAWWSTIIRIPPGRASRPEGLLRGAQPAVRAGEELSRRACCWRRRSRRWRATCWHLRYLLQGRGSAARFRAEGNAGPKMLWYVLRAHAALLASLPRLWRQRRAIRARRPHHAGRLPPSAARPFHQRQEGGRALIRPTGPDSLLVIVPALNEEGAIAERGARHPRARARCAGAGDRRLFGRRHHRAWRARPAPRSCRCRITWAWADACRPATSWPTSWGSDYVIRVDGDGQHDAARHPAHLRAAQGHRAARW